jgi:hypothetical protein
VAVSGEEIRRRLAEFAARWGGYQGSERSEAQTFLNELLTCYGTERRDVGARFEDVTPSGGFMDMLWPRVCIVEMKRPAEAGRLEHHRRQALDYWRESGTPETPAPRYVVMCAFHRFEVWEPGAVFNEPRDAFDLAELPDHMDSLLFLAGRQPVFVASQAELTRGAVALVTDLYSRLGERRAADAGTLRAFALQLVWSLFAEDAQMLPSHLLTRVVDELLVNPERSSADDLGQLFRYLAEPEPRPQHGLYAGTPYVDGACSHAQQRCTSSTTSCGSSVTRATSTGSASSRRSSAPSCRERLGEIGSGRSEPTTRRKPTSSRWSSLPSLSPGGSGSRSADRSAM